MRWPTSSMRPRWTLCVKWSTGKTGAFLGTRGTRDGDEADVVDSDVVVAVHRVAVVAVNSSTALSR